MQLLTCKAIVVTSLVVIFLGIFGQPSLVKYMQKDTIFTEAKIKYDPLKPPAITIFAWRDVLFYGWKNAPYKPKAFCNVSDAYEEFFQCINDKTFKHSDIVQSAALEREICQVIFSGLMK